MSSHTSWFSITTGHMAEATFRFTIDNFNNRPEKFKESVKSPCFRVNGPGDLITKWQLEIYPKGRDEVYKKYVGIILNNIGQVKVAAKYKIDVIDGAGEEREQYESQVRDYDIGRGITFWGKRNWLKRGKFNDHSDLLPYGNLILQCTVTVFGPQRAPSGSDFDSTNSDLLVHSQKQVCQQLGNAFFEKLFTDVRIQCEGQTFDCHKAVLAARSPVFQAMFETNMKEKETNTVTIEDFKPEVVSEMLAFIYTGNISSQDTISEITTELLAVAVKYQLDNLRDICEERLCSTLEVANCVEYLMLGDMLHTFMLKRMALRLVVENVDSITDTDVIKDLFKQKTELAIEVMKAVNIK